MLTYFEENLNLIWKGYILYITGIGQIYTLEDLKWDSISNLFR
jgi:hypothetical protein